MYELHRVITKPFEVGTRIMKGFCVCRFHHLESRPFAPTFTAGYIVQEAFR